MSIEDVILDHDKRGMFNLRPHLPEDFCIKAAHFIEDNPGPAIITTGFYILAAGKAETDGPPGAVAIGRALRTLGREVYYVSDKYTVDVLHGLDGDSSEVIEFPVCGHSESEKFAKELVKKLSPSLIISIERCSVTADGVYRNMLGVDISDYTAKVDYIFDEQPCSIGIGDGGNEIGMGNLREVISEIDNLPQDPAVTETSELLIASVSNWGGLGLVAGLSRVAGRNLLPSRDDEADLIRESVNLGAVDGMSTKPENKVDSFTIEQDASILDRLHSIVG